ncbi:MAG: hypothetical protein L0Y71_14325 [Gemmataceae bacterium]|nr:hypothetical protein [Gemmataceae bacterium]
MPSRVLLPREYHVKALQPDTLLDIARCSEPTDAGHVAVVINLIRNDKKAVVQETVDIAKGKGRHAIEIAGSRELVTKVERVTISW